MMMTVVMMIVVMMVITDDDDDLMMMMITIISICIFAPSEIYSCRLLECINASLSKSSSVSSYSFSLSANKAH